MCIIEYTSVILDKSRSCHMSGNNLDDEDREDNNDDADENEDDNSDLVFAH